MRAELRTAQPPGSPSMAPDRDDRPDDLPYKSLNLMINSGEKAPLLTATFTNRAPYGQTRVGMGWWEESDKRVSYRERLSVRRQSQRQRVRVGLRCSLPVYHQIFPVPDEQLPIAALPALHPCSVPPLLQGLSANPPDAHCWPTPGLLPWLQSPTATG
jgi:hypothetical protein